MRVGTGQDARAFWNLWKLTDEEEDERLTFPDVTKEKLGFGDETDKNCESNMIKERLFYSRKKFTGLLVACVIF